MKRISIGRQGTFVLGICLAVITAALYFLFDGAPATPVLAARWTPASDRDDVQRSASLEELRSSAGRPDVMLGVRVLSAESGAGVSSAIVTRIYEDEQPIPFSADPAGRVSIPLRRDTEADLEVSADGFHTRRLTSPGSVDSELAVELYRLGTLLTGVVEDAAGLPLANMLVWAWPMAVFPSPDDLRLELEGERRSLAYTDAEGYFQIPIDEAIHDWQVTAAGHGRIARTAPIVSAANSSTVRLVAYPLHGAKIDLVDARGGPLRTSARASIGTRSLATMRAHGAAKVTPDWPSLWLLGYVDADWDRVVGPVDEPILYIATRDEPTAELGPVDIEYQALGYAPLRESTALPRLEAELPKMEFALEPTAERWCELMVTVVGPCADDVARTGTLPSVVGRLRSRTTGVECGFGIDALTETTISLGEVPQDEYEWSWETTHHFYASPLSDPVELDLRADSYVLLLDASNLGCVLTSVLLPDGRAYDGYLLLQFESIVGGEADRSAFCSYFRAPYIIEGMSPGTYRAAVVAPGILGSAAPVEFAVQSGQRTQIEFR